MATKSAAKKTAAKKAAPAKLPTVREDTPNPELTDLDRDPDTVCAYCGRDAVARRADNGTPLCEKHQSRAEARGRETSKL